jgi:hypothetical protein
MSETPPPPPNSIGSAPASTAAHAKNMVRNVAVSVTSTVLGATLIYFLGFQHKNGGGGASPVADMLVTKEATSKAWKGYVAVENIYYKNSQSIMKDLQATKQLDDFEENIIKESDKFQTDLPQVLKDQNIDGAFISLINRRLENEKGTEVKMKKYLSNLQAIVKGGYSQTEKQQKLQAEDASWATYSKGTVERAITDLEDLAKILSDRYQIPFAMTDLLVYNEIKKAENNQPGTNNENNNAGTKDNNGGAPTNIPTEPNAEEPKNGPVNTADRNNEVKDPDNYKAEEKQKTDGGVKDRILGEWYTNDAEIGIFRNGTMYWNLQNGETTGGNWKFSNNQLIMYPRANYSIPQGTIWTFNISNILNGTMTLTLATRPFNVYHLTRNEIDD